MKYIITGFLLLFATTTASAHVTVKPSEVGVGQRLNFVVSVPTEEPTPTIQVRLIIPEGVKSVRPNVKPGWNIQIVKTGEGENERVTELIWSSGRIPADQRDEFIFSAQAPTNAGTIIWKAYQTYGDGNVVAWDASPEIIAEYTKNNPPVEDEEDDHDAPRPYSESKVVDDLETSTLAPGIASTGSSQTSIYASTLAIILSLVAIVMVVWKKTS